MMKKSNITLMIIVFLVMMVPLKGQAIVIYESTGSIFKGDPYYSSANDRYYLKFNPTNVKRIWLASYTDASYSTILSEKEIIPPEGKRFSGLSDFTCKRPYKTIYYDGAGNVLGTLKFNADEIVNGACDSGSGGGEGDEDPQFTDDSGCTACFFKCPGWDEYMGKIDEIRDAIPPPPNWPVVADTFRDSIVPKVINDLDNLLGRAPSPPSPPPQLPNLDDRGIKNKEPQMKDVPGLKESGFDANKIKNEAPTIPEREDPTDGFDLIQNPMDTLPEAPENPKPGETDAGEWGQNKPKEEENPFPFPQDTGEPNMGKPPKPSDNEAKPPAPGGNPGSAPKPGGDIGNGPSPGGTGGDAGMKDYKPSPGAPDGSGGDIWP